MTGGLSTQITIPYSYYGSVIFMEVTNVPNLTLRILIPKDIQRDPYEYVLKRYSSRLWDPKLIKYLNLDIWR